MGALMATAWKSFSDGFQNVMAALGVSTSKSAGNSYVSRAYSDAELRIAYEGSWALKKCIDAPLGDMLRPRRTWDGDPEKVEAILAEERRLRLWPRLMTALRAADIMGGAGLIFVTAGNDLAAPPEFGRGGLIAIQAEDKAHLQVTLRDDDPFSERYGLPAVYSWSTIKSSHRVHADRVIRIASSAGYEDRSLYWPKGRLQFILDAAQKFDATNENIGELVHKALIDVIRSKDLAQRTRDKVGAEMEIKRLRLLKDGAANANLMLLDMMEEFERQSFTFQGLEPLMKAFAGHLAAAADIPVTRLMGTSPGGLNATGESDARNYYDAIDGRRKNELAPILDRIDEAIQTHLFGEPQPDLRWEFGSLWQETAKERAERTKIEVEAIERMSLMPDASRTGLTAGVDSYLRSTPYLSGYAEAADAEEEFRAEAGDIAGTDDPEADDSEGG